MNRLSRIVVCLVVLLAACEAEPTTVSNPTRVVSTAAPSQESATSAGTGVPNSTATRDIGTPESGTGGTAEPGLPTATQRPAPSGAVVIAGTEPLTREITKMPEFVSQALFDSLLRVDPKDGHLLPGLAERWLVSADAKTFVFMLRDGVKWSDGTALTAEDVAYTLNAFADPEIRTNPAADFGPVDKITATDARTVSVTFKEAYCAALTYVGAVPILPKHRMEGKDLTNVADEDLVGTGPLVVKTWGDDEITFARNTRYRGEAAKIGDWVYRLYPSGGTARAAVEQGNADFVVSDTAARGMPNLSVPMNQFYALAFNNKRAPFDEVKVRQAIAMGLDRAALANAFNPPQQVLATSLLAPFWAAPNIPAPQFDLAKAKQGLADAGWRDTNGDGIVEKNRKDLEVTLWAESELPQSELTAQLLREQLEQVGVRAILKMTDRLLFLTREFLHEYDLALVSFNIPLDPDQHYLWASDEAEPGFGLNVTGYANSSVDAGLAAGNSTPRCEMTARKNAYAPVFRQVTSDTPMAFLFAPMGVASTSARLNGISPSSFAGAFWNLEEWTVGQ